VNPVVVEIGPQTIRGPNSAPQEWISVAIGCIDDQIAVLGERLVEVARLWSDILEVIAGEHAEALVLVFPTWWSSARVELVTAAAHNVAAEVVVLQRASVLGADSDATVIELSEEFVVTAPPGSEVTVLPRGEHDVAAPLGAAGAILVDVPADVSPLGPRLTAQLRAAGIPVAHSDRHRLLCAVTAALPDRAVGDRTRDRPRPSRRTVAILAGAVLSAAAVGGGWAAQALSGHPPGDTSTALLVEGRVAVRVPAHWVVERITSGPGSARLRVSAPTADATALHITQSVGATSTTIAEAAEPLRRALEFEAPGVFTDFDPAGSIGGRPAVTYRESRAGSETIWAVVVDGAIRIAIGCQSPPAHRDPIDDACVRAVQSAHVVR
jgi:type VII secretion-associated protein (TIGR03931 family)